MAEAIDFRALRMSDLSRALGVPVSTIESYRSQGLPAVGTGTSGMRYNLPDTIAWLRARDAEERKRERREKKGISDDASDEEIALAALRREVRDGSGISAVNAAKALLARADEQRVPDPVADNVVAFIELANAAGTIEAAAISAPCPQCGAVVSLRKQA